MSRFKLFRHVTILSALICFVVNGWGQIAVTVTGNTNTTPNLAASYTSMANFVTALNGVTAVSGSVTATLAAGSSETAPIKGFNISTSTANVFTTTNTLTIVKASGSATTINAGVGTAASPGASSDGMLYLSGMDGVTIDGLTFTDGNTATATVAMEFGIAFFKRAAGDGCNGNTIQNCTFNMQRISNGSGTAPMGDGAIAIIAMNSTPAANTTALTPTNGGTLATNGTNSNNKFYSNTINGGNAGIYLSGFAATVGVGPTPTATTFLGDLGNDIGGTGVSTFTNGNSILNFGGGASSQAAVGIRANNQWSLNVSNNTVNNNNGSGINHATTLRGIYLQAGTSANVTCTYNSVTIQSGATTSSCTAIDNIIGSTAASNQVNINNNTIRIGYATATTGVMTGISNTSTAATVNINLNNIQKVTGVDLAGTGTHVMIETGSPTTANTNTNTVTNLTRGGASGSWRGIKTTSPGTWNADGNTIDGLSWTAAASTGSIDAFYSFSFAVTVNITNNIIRNLSTPTTGTITGITENGSSSGAKTFTGNQIYNFSTTAGGVGGATFRGISESTGTTNTFTNNLIYSLNSTGSTGGTAGTIVGITVSSGTTNNFTRNAIYDLSTTSTNPTVSGITLAGGTTNNVSNNLIGDLRSTASTAAVGLSGILVSSGTTNNIFHNTVNLNTTGGTTFGSSGIYFSSSTPLNNFRNNIIVNTSTPGSTSGITAAIRYVTAPTSTNFPAANNNNLYFVGTAAANKVLYADNTTSANNQQTIAGYKTYINTTLPVAGREAGSVSENPSFTSTAGSNPITTFLQYPTGTALQLEQGGGIGTLITTDFTGTTVRCPGGSCPGSASTPDMGAWELNGTAADFTAPSISYTALSNTLCTNGQTLSATITDASSVNVTAGTAPRIYFKKSTDANTYVGNTSADNGWKFVESSSSASPFSFTIDASLLQSSLAATDVIQYFVVAQDLATVPNVGLNSGIFASTPSTVALTSAAFALTGTINSYTILTPIPTSVTIGAAGTYTSITGTGGLFAAINAGGLSGNTVATIIDASVTETGATALNQISYACTPNVTLTIKPATGVNATISGSSSGAIIKLNGADYVTIDGSNNGTNSRNLTITNTNTGTSSAVIWLASVASPANGAINNIVKNTIVNGNATTTTLSGIISCGSTIGSEAEAPNNGNVMDNNLVSTAYYGIAIVGATATESSVVVSNNTINTIGLQAIFVSNQQSLEVSGNTVSNVTTSANINTAGIYIVGTINGGTISRNVISNIKNTATAGRQAMGIWLVSSSAASGLTISNNMIFDIANSASSATLSRSSHGIYIATGGGYNIYYNTVNLNTNPTAANTSGNNAALYVASGVTGLNIRNNIFANNQSTSVNRFAIYSDAANTAFTNINYNNYFSTGTSIGFIGSARTTLTDVITGFGGNANSMNVNPQFVSATDLHINSGSTQTQLESGGVAISGLTTDIDGQTRPGPTGSTNGGGIAPDLGADEFDGVPLPQCTTPTVQASVVTITNLSATTATVSFTAGNGGSYLVVTATGSAPSNPVDGTTYALNSTALGTGTTVVGNGTVTTYSLTGLTAEQAYTVYVYAYNNTSCLNGPDYATPAATASFTTCASTIATAPVSSTATNVGPYGFTANWAAVSGWTPTNYILDVATDAGFNTLVSGYSALNVSNVTSFNVTGLGSATPYFYRVRATDGTCTTPNSLSQNPTTGALTSIATGDWSSGSTWSGGIVPTCIDNISILTGHTVTVNSSSNVSKNVTIDLGGALTVASGDLTVGCTLNNTPFTNNGTLTVTGGTLNINGNLSCGSSSVFNQSGGAINIDGNNGGSTTGSVASGTPLLNLLQFNSGINWIGGSLNIIDPHTANTAATGRAIVFNNATLANTTNFPTNGHTVSLGNGISTDAGGHTSGFSIDHWTDNAFLTFGNLVVNGPSGINRIVSFRYSGGGVRGNITINSGGLLLLSDFYFGGDITVNSGSTLVSTGTLYTRYVSSYDDLGNIYVTASSASQSIGGSGTIQNLSSSPTASLTSLSIFNTSSGGFTISAPLSLSGTLTMTDGKINTTATNLLTLGTLTAAGTLSYTSGQITGPFARTFATSSSTTAVYDATTLFPVGDGTNYIPIHIDPVNGGGVVQMRGQAFNTNSGTGGAGVASVLSADRWEALVTTGTITDCFIGLNDAQIASGNIIAQSSSANGTYNAVSGASTFVSGTPNALRTAVQIPNASYSGYFTYAAPGPVITSFTPSSACPNAATTITITGTNLGSATAVTLNGEACTIVTNTSTQLVVTTDATPQAGSIVVTTSANSSTSGSALSLFTLPTVTASSDASNNTICSGSNITLNGAGAGVGGSYTWNNSATNNVAFAPTSSTTYTVTGTDGNGCTNTASISVTVNQIVAITSQPSNQVVLPNDNATFSVSATGTGLAYQWQENTGAGWNSISNGGIYSGSTTSTLTLTGVTSTNNGSQYQCVISGTAPCSNLTSSSATLTISSTAISAHPVNQTICVTAGTATFSITTTGATPSYQWQVSTNSGSTWTDITNETSSSLSLSGLTLTDNGNLYRCLLNSGAITSNSASLSVNAASVAGTTSADQAICSSASAANITLSGNTGTIQWQVSSDNSIFANISNATASPLTSAQIGSLSATRYYRAVVTSGVCSATNSSVVTITVTTAPNAGTLSGTQAVCIGATTSFSSNGNSGGSWSSSNGSTASINSSGTVTGVAAGTATMTYTIIGAGGCSTVTATRTVTVNSLPSSLSITPSTASICSGSIQSLVASGGDFVSLGLNLGTSTNLNGTTAYPSPYSNYYGGVKHQILIKANELTALGLVNGSKINSIGFNVSGVGSTFSGSLNNFSIHMGHTSTTALSSSSFVTGLSIVLPAATVSVPTTGLPATLTHNLPTGFTWNGTDNIVIQTSYSNVNSGTTTDFVTMTNSDPGFVSTNWYRADGATASTVLSAATPTSSGSARPNMVFGISTQQPITWSPTTALYTDAAATIAYTGTAATTVYAKPTTTTTYTATATATTGCTSSSTATITVNQPTLTWTGATSTDPTDPTNWNPVALPCPVSDITVPGGLTNYPIYPTTLTISSGGSYTLQAGAQLTVNGTLTNNGTFNLQNGATFVQGTSGTSIAGTGTYNVEKALTDNSSTWSTTSGRFWYMGVPMVNVARSSYGTPGTTTNLLWSYTEATKSYTELSDGTALLSAGTGYVHRRSTDGTLTFSATGANGLYGSNYTASGLTKTAGYTSGVNLVSNPYMAYLDWVAVVAASPTIDPTFYIRSNNVAGGDISALISYNANNPTLFTNTSSVNITNASQIRYIAPMQSVWVKVDAGSSTGTLNMTRSMLSHQSGNPGLKSSTVFPTLAKVNLVDGNRFDQMLVYMNSDMTNEVDQYDSEKLPVSGTVQLYTMASNKKLVMNGLKNNKKKVSVPLYLDLPASKSYTLQLADYVLEDGLILLEDKQEGTMQDFTLLGNYTFNANSGQLYNRFVLHFILPNAELTTQGPSNSWVGPETSYTDGGNVQITNDDRGNIEITVDQPEEQKVEGNVTVTDMNGKEVYKGQLDGITTAVSLNVPAGIYYLTVQSGTLFEKKKVFIQD